MKTRFSVGLPVARNDAFLSELLRCRADIAEVYFSYGDFPSGRGSPAAAGERETAEQTRARQMASLGALHEAGIPLNLLLNANCYGAESQSRAFFERIGETVDSLRGYGLSSVTTTSPLIARFIHENFAGIETRASVNMEIGTVEGMRYVEGLFDGYYLRREYNRDLRRIRAARAYCDGAGKRLYMLANSGCLNFCSAHIFHDNLVAHEAEIARQDNAYAFMGVCRDFLSDPARRAEYPALTNFVRPEDIDAVAPYFDGIKLATRVTPHAGEILRAYLRRRHSGAVTDLLEPCHTALFFPYIFENRRIPDDFFGRVSTCDKDCGHCDYCKQITGQALVNPEEYLCSLHR